MNETNWREIKERVSCFKRAKCIALRKARQTRRCYGTIGGNGILSQSLMCRAALWPLIG